MAILPVLKVFKMILVLFLLFSFCDCKLEPYRILGVDRQASTQEIRKAYKNKAKEWHPDKNDSPNAQDKFVEINAAYELLSDAERRKNYDRHGVGKKHALKKYDQFALNTSCFYPRSHLRNKKFST